MAGIQTPNHLSLGTTLTLWVTGNHGSILKPKTLLPRITSTPLMLMTGPTTLTRALLMTGVFGVNRVYASARKSWRNQNHLILPAIIIIFLSLSNWCSQRCTQVLLNMGMQTLPTKTRDWQLLTLVTTSTTL